ncbi:MAG TPA: hypothetical protein VLK65_23085 [Vicinamibacteria bacterium]|nr:hypothetical protein [Vicinamibacteria bacterium]
MKRLVLLGAGFVLVLLAVAAESQPKNVAILGRGVPYFIAKFTGSRTIGPSAIFENQDGVGVGTTNPGARLHVASDFAGGGPTINVDNQNVDGDVAVDFLSGGELMANVVLIKEQEPHRLGVLQNNAFNIPLTLSEWGNGPVGIWTGNPDPTKALDVNGDGNFNGSLTVSGNLSVMGAKASVANLPDGQRVTLYAVESPENWFEDFGTAQLHDGVAWVALDSTFAQTVNTALVYHVFVTSNGDCKGLFISQKTPSHFEVRELDGGNSDVPFDYRIVARRRGYESLRLQKIS